MAKELMKEQSIERLYDYPESGVMNKELCFLVLSVEKKESNRVYVELTDLKYKVRNVILINEKEQEDIKILGKKTERDETNIIFLAGKKIFINSFVPDINELNKFLNECTIIEIDKKDINDEIKKINDKKIFDPDEFIQKNYGLGNKNNISIEDLDFLFEKNNKTEKYEENQIIEKSEIQAKEERNINEILQEKNIDKQKKEINQLK